MVSLPLLTTIILLLSGIILLLLDHCLKAPSHERTRSSISLEQSPYGWNVSCNCVHLIKCTPSWKTDVILRKEALTMLHYCRARPLLSHVSYYYFAVWYVSCQPLARKRADSIERIYITQYDIHLRLWTKAAVFATLDSALCTMVISEVATFVPQTFQLELMVKPPGWNI